MNMQSEVPRSRRELLSAAIGGIAGLAAATLGRPTIASADTGDNLVLGTNNTADASTSLTLTDPNLDVPALDISATGPATGINVAAQEGVGIKAWLSAIDPAPDTNQTAVFAGADMRSGFRALRVDGRVSFRRSGRAEIAAGQSSVEVEVPGFNLRTTFGFATLNTNRPGVFVRAVVVNWTVLPKNTITIHLNKRTPYKTRCAWFLFN